MGTQHNKVRLALFCNYLNHHQVHLADAFFELLGDKFVFVATLPVSQTELKGGTDYSHERQYCINPNDGSAYEELAREYAREAEVAIFGACSLKYAVERAKNGNGGLSFDCSERWFKKGIVNLFSPVFLTWYYSYLRYFKDNNFYKLCAGSFVSKDNNYVGAYLNKCFKWGYFTEISSVLEAPDRVLPEQKRTPILWCARFLFLKHPELPVKLAERLKKKGYNFVIDMYGTGPELEPMKELAAKLNVSDVVRFHGNVPNAEVLKQMREHSIFLFTSDRHEGWGAVANEAMSSGCVIVASDSIGSVPFLVRDSINGCVFKSGDLESLERKVEFLLTHPQDMKSYSEQAVKTMRDIWSPGNAAKSFLKLVNDLEEGRQPSIVEGPCSNA